MNEDRIIQSLTQYQGTQESLNETVSVLSEELGETWVTDVFERLGGLPPNLKEKLNHVFNYYSALLAWQESQTYLSQTEPLDDSIQERLPVLKHWLNFFGDEGVDLYQKLEQKVQHVDIEEEKSDEDLEKEEQNPLAEEQKGEERGQKIIPSENEKSEIEEENKEETKETVAYDSQSKEAFSVQKAEKEIRLLEGVQSWLSARCLQLNNMEVFVYPYYGFVVDLMRQTVKDIQSVLDMEDKSALNALYEGGEEAIIRKKQAIEADIETAVQNCESATTALIDENIDMDTVRKTLGDLDENPEPEYLGPAPDGFELIDNSDVPLDEKAVKEQYQKLEKEVLAEESPGESTFSEKKTSQKNGNSVQRKLSFSLKPKK